MKSIKVGLKGTIKSGVCAGMSGKVIAYYSEDDDVVISIDASTDIHTVSDNVEQ